MCTFSSENVCEEEHTQVVGSCDTQEAYNSVQELSPAILEKLAHYQRYKVICFWSSCLQLKVSCSQTWDVDTSERVIGVYFFWRKPHHMFQHIGACGNPLSVSRVLECAQNVFACCLLFLLNPHHLSWFGSRKQHSCLHLHCATTETYFRCSEKQSKAIMGYREIAMQDNYVVSSSLNQKMKNSSV